MRLWRFKTQNKRSQKNIEILKHDGPIESPSSSKFSSEHSQTKSPTEHRRWLWNLTINESAANPHTLKGNGSHFSSISLHTLFLSWFLEATFVWACRSNIVTHQVFGQTKLANVTSENQADSEPNLRLQKKYALTRLWQTSTVLKFDEQIVSNIRCRKMISTLSHLHPRGISKYKTSLVSCVGHMCCKHSQSSFLSSGTRLSAQAKGLAREISKMGGCG